MNWYKISQNTQTHMDFYADILPAPPQKDEFLETLPKTKDLLETIIEDENNFESMIKSINKFGFEWEKISLSGNYIFKITTNDGVYLITDPQYPELKNPEEWITNMFDSELYSYMPPSDFGQVFWKDIPRNYMLYHATYSDHLEEIKKNGLQLKNETRSISNKNTGAAIFTCDNPDDIANHGNIIIQIDVSKMKQDGYTPDVSKETPIEEAETREALANKLGLEMDFISNYSSEGVYTSTVIFYGPIPPKYLGLYKG